MPTITLPFFFRVQEVSSKASHGWCPIDVDVKEIGADQLKMAVCDSNYGSVEFLGSKINSVYLHEQTFYKSAGRNKDDSQSVSLFNEREVFGEVPFADLPEAALKSLTNGISVSVMGGLAHRQKQPILTTSRLNMHSIDATHIAEVRDWASRRLLMCEGRLFEETKRPALMLLLGPKGQMFDRAIFQTINFDRERAGLYFGYPCDEFYRLRDEAKRLGLMAQLPFGVQQMVDIALAEARKVDEYVAVGSASYNVSVLSRVRNEDYLAKRGLDFTARECMLHGMKQKAPHMFSRYSKLIEKQLLISPDDKADSYFDELIEGLKLFGARASKWESWAAKRAVERYEDREISTEPVRAASSLSVGGI